jgi:hypothetical protein
MSEWADEQGSLVREVALVVVSLLAAVALVVAATRFDGWLSSVCWAGALVAFASFAFFDSMLAYFWLFARFVEHLVKKARH